MQHRSFTAPDDKQADTTALLLFKVVISCSKSFTFFFFLLLFFEVLVAVSKAVSHSAVWELQSVGHILSTGRPAADANENHNP